MVGRLSRRIALKETGKRKVFNEGHIDWLDSWSDNLGGAHWADVLF